MLGSFIFLFPLIPSFFHLFLLSIFLLFCLFFLFFFLYSFFLNVMPFFLSLLLSLVRANLPASVIHSNFRLHHHSCPFLALNLTPAIPAVGGLLFIFVMSALFHTSFTDPGIIPRATVEEAVYTEKQIGEASIPLALSLFLFSMHFLLWVSI